MSNYTSTQNAGGTFALIGASLTVAGVAYFSFAAALILLGVYVMVLGFSAFTK